MDFATLASFKDVVITFARDNQALIAPLVFVLGFCESIALVSLFVPSTLLFLAIGAIHHAAGGTFVPVWIAGAAGAFLGDVVSYVIGYWLKDRIAQVWPFSKYPQFISRAKEMDEKWGSLALIGSKFLGMLRPFAPVMAGTIDMPRVKFALASAIGSLLWAGVFLAPGFGYELFL